MTAPLVGVNLGGWLVLEEWITPSLFKGTDAQDEYTFMQSPGAVEKLTAHRDTYVVESDFEWLACHGVTAVRIPVGYWLLDGDAPFIGGTKYLDWAFAMADKYKLAVLLDIHGLPGSQNGNDHSGRSGTVSWQKDPVARARSLEIVRQFAKTYGREPALWGIEIINEPNPGAFQLALRQYYRRAYRLLDMILPPAVKIVYSDAWSPRIFALALPARHRAVMDVHLYHMATLGATKHSLEWYYRVLTRRVAHLHALSRLRPMIIGEWSGVISGETLEGSPDADVKQADHYAFQKKQYARFAGTFYWTYKIEDSTGLNFWDYRSVIENVK